VTESARRTALLERAEQVAAVMMLRSAGLLGRAWKAARCPTSRAEVASEDGLLALRTADRAGLRGAVAIPGLNGDAVLAGVDVYGREDDEISRRLMPTLAGMRTLGAFLAGLREPLDVQREAA
jgi:hypothetical protein